MVNQAVNVGVPAPGKHTIFPKADGFYQIDQFGVVTKLEGGVTVITVVDITDPSTELNPLSGSSGGDLRLCVEEDIGANDQSTLYKWDTDAGAQDIPYVVNGTGGGRWVAIAGRFQAQIIDNNADENKIRFFYGTFAGLPAFGPFHGMFAHVHAPTDETNGQTALFAHSTGWIELKNRLRSTRVALAGTDVNFGNNVATASWLLTKTLAVPATLTISNPKIDREVWLEFMSSGASALTFPASVKVVQGSYDTSGALNYIRLLCVDAVAPTYLAFIYKVGATAELETLEDSDESTTTFTATSPGDSDLSVTITALTAGPCRIDATYTGAKTSGGVESLGIDITVNDVKCVASEDSDHTHSSSLPGNPKASCFASPTIGQVVRMRWFTSGGTITADERSLKVTRLGVSL